jgi:hypothetical protein
VEISDVLQTVISESSTDFFVHRNSSLQAVEVNVANRFIDVQSKSGGKSNENAVESLDGIKLSSEFFVSLSGLEVFVFALEVSELNISGVNKTDVLVGVFNLLGNISLVNIAVSFEVSNDFGINFQISVLLDVRLGGQVLDDVELFQKGFLGGVNRFEVFQEVDGVQITQARSDVLSVNLVIRSAVSSPRAFLTISGGGGINVDVGREEVVEHGAGFAGFNIDDHFLVHVVVMHENQSIIEILSIKIGGGEGDETSGTVISEIDEDVVFSSALEDSVATNLGGIALEDGQEVFGGDFLLAIVDLDASVDILAFTVSGLVEDLASEGVLEVVGNIVKGKSDDVVSGNSVVNQDLISVENVRLMSVVVVSLGSGNEDSVVGSLGADNG